VFTARYALSPYIKQIRFVFKGLIWFGSEGSRKIMAPFDKASVDDDVLFVAGNLMVILVVTFSRRLRSITNFFLANLAVADFCVGVFCVYQNISTYVVSK
jgi:hypothetical protein